MRICELKIQIQADREKLVAILASAGYRVSIEERGEWPKHECWVIVEDKDGDGDG